MPIAAVLTSSWSRSSCRLQGHFRLTYALLPLLLGDDQPSPGVARGPAKRVPVRVRVVTVGSFTHRSGASHPPSAERYPFPGAEERRRGFPAPSHLSEAHRRCTELIECSAAMSALQSATTASRCG